MCSSHGLRRHQGMKRKNAKLLLEKASKLTASEFSGLVKRCSSICQHDLCLPEDIRSKFHCTKKSFALKISSVNVTKSAVSESTFTEEILNGKHDFCAVFGSFVFDCTLMMMHKNCVNI